MSHSVETQLNISEHHRDAANTPRALCCIFRKESCAFLGKLTGEIYWDENEDDYGHTS